MAKSAHQPFETWLLAGEPLTDDQAHALRDHLHDCADCQQLETAWNGVRQTFRVTPEVAPAPGFTARWQTRLAAQRLERQRRQAWTALILTFGVVAELILALGAQFLSVLRQPGQLLITWVYFVSRIVALSQATQSAWDTLTGVNIIFPIVGSFFLIGSLSFWSVLWVVVYKQLSARRIRS